MTDKQEQPQLPEGPPFLGPNNGITKNPPSRSQSPAKRLKSEDPPTTTTHNPVGDDDGDAVMEDADQPERSRLASVEMADADDFDSTTASNGPTSTAPSSAGSALPNLDEQVQSIILDKMCPLIDGDDYYIISGAWLKRFIAQDPEYAKEISKEDLEKPVGPIDNSAIVDTAQMEEIERRRSNDSSSASTGDSTEDFIPIKQGESGEDFEILSAKAWSDLVSWYGLAKDSPVIKRKAVNTAEDIGSENIQVELYPPMFTIYRLRDPASPITKESLTREKEQKPKKVVSARSEGFQKFLKKIKTVAEVDATRKVRIWKVVGVTPDEQEKSSKKKTGAFKQMVLDLQAFLDTPYSDRELVDIKDQTNDQNYNGKGLKVGMTGLSTGGAIIVEEQTSDGGWISEAPVKTASKFGEVVTVIKHGFKASKLSEKKKQEKDIKSPTSRSSSPSKSIMSRGSSIFTRSRERREGRALGTCGLNNLGNTCYMNSALQCLRGVEELSKYFLLDEYEKELNPSNPLAHNGKVAKAYAGLLKNIFSPSSPQAYAPREFKGTIGRFGPSFSGYQQQDSQEFLAFLLDGLHEDLNRIVKKPYIERPDSTDDMVGDPEKIAKLAETHWDIYKKRNDSAVADLFAGLYKSTLVCPDCGKVSITFDPFMDLTLPLPIESLWSHQVVFYPLEKGKYPGPVKVPVEMAKHSSIAALKDLLGKKFNIDPKKIMGSEVYKHRFYRHYDDGMSVSETISTNDEAIFYELDEIPTNWPGPKPKKRSMLSFSSSDDDMDNVGPDSPESEKLLVPVFHHVKSQRNAFGSSSDQPFGFPSFIVLTKEDQNNYEAILNKLFLRIQILTTRDLLEVIPEPDIGEAEDEEESSVENVSKPEIKLDKPDDEKDGFVDVSMQDAESVTDAEETQEPKASLLSTTAAAPKGRKVTAQIAAQLFEVKLAPKKSDRVPTGWSGLNGDVLMTSRLNRSRSPSPARQKRTSGFLRNLTGGGSGIRTPVSPQSDITDNDDSFDVPERESPEMRDVSDDETDPYCASHQDLSSFNAVPPSGFYGGANESPASTSRPSPSPRNISPAPGKGSQPLVRFGEAIILEWTDSGYEAIFGGKPESDDFRGVETWSKLTTMEDPELARARRRREERRAKGIHLEDCLDEFAKEEVLSADDPWFCPKCKEHRRATKKFELWKCPDILVIHLKRFSSSRSFRDKIDVMIDCPVEELDLETRVGVTEGKEMVYDLFAVDNHYGGLGGGHYTAYVKNWYDGKWYYCDDASVRETAPSSVVTPAAYLLFYRRRSAQHLGGPAYNSLLSSAENTHRLSVESVSTPGRSPAASDIELDDDEDSDDGMNITSPSARKTASTSSMIGPIIPSTAFYQQQSVGNETLWGSSMPVPVRQESPTLGDETGRGKEAEQDVLPSYEESVSIDGASVPPLTGKEKEVVSEGVVESGGVNMDVANSAVAKDAAGTGERDGKVPDERVDVGGVVVHTIPPPEEGDEEAVEVRV